MNRVQPVHISNDVNFAPTKKAAMVKSAAWNQINNALNILFEFDFLVSFSIISTHPHGRLVFIFFFLPLHVALHVTVTLSSDHATTP